MTLTRRRLLSTTVAAAPTAALAGCSLDDPTPPPNETPAQPPTGGDYAYTHLQPDGNRTLQGRGNLPGAEPVDIEFEGRPAWLLAQAAETGSFWTVVRRDNTAATYRVADGGAERLTDHGPVASPPVGYQRDGTVRLLDAPREVGEHTHPVPISGGFLYVAADGDVVRWRADGTTRLDAAAPPDVRPVALGGDRYLVYGRGTDRYRHGALGDDTEPSSLLVVDAAAAEIETETRLDAPLVFEGLAPLVADLDGDGDPEVVTTVADSSDGARIRVYRPDGTAVATGPTFGPGWRHQLCVAPFGPDGRPELAVVLKPHVTRTLEFYRLADDSLSVATTHDGLASHTYGSRNVDGGLAADLDGDGRTELLTPTSDRDVLAAVRRTDGGARTVWSLDLDGRLGTNVAGVALDDDRVAVGAGTDDVVRVWQG